MTKWHAHVVHMAQEHGGCPLSPP